MGKIKISELAKELGVEGKAVVSFLQEQGVEAAKRSTSSVEDDAADIARKHFGSAGGQKKAEDAPKAARAAKSDKVQKTDSGNEQAPAAAGKDGDEPKPPKTPVTEKKEDTAAKPSVGESDVKPAAAQKAARPVPRKPAEGGADAAKKKKKIIVISNPNNSRTQAGAYNSDAGRGRMPARQKGAFGGTQVHQIIRPHTAPSQPETYNREVSRLDIPKPHPAKEKPAPVKEEPVAKPVPEQEAVVEKPAEVPEKPVEKPEVKAAPVTAPEASKPAPAAPSPRNDRRTVSQPQSRPAQGRPGQPGRQGAPGQGQRTGAPASGYGQGRGSFPGRQGSGFGGRGPGSQGQGGFNGRGNAAPGQGGFGNKFGQGQNQAPGRDGGKRQRGKDKDKDKRKDIQMENEEGMSRSKRAGRFIKPEVKPQEPEEQIKVITIPETLTIKDLAQAMHMQPSGIIKKLFLAGKIMTVNSELTYEEAENIAIEYDIICEKEEQVDIIEELLKEEDDAEETLKKRPPVVCVMGHVDHGKTSLLDAIRKTNVSDREAGGITQAIGAYTVSVKGQKITFLDTPGHEAFTAMRMRGANSTDIAVLVVAADDGVMPQTVEAINHAKAANVEIIVAVNKIDKPNANIDRVKQEMTEYGLIATDWGGQTEFVPVSAKTGEGMENLLETIILTADILELKANPNRIARGIVLEAKLDKGRGPVATVLVQKGTLRVGDFISAGASSGKVRAMIDDRGRRVREATPSEPVEILGLSDVPDAGEVFLGHESDKEAKQYADTYMKQHKKELIDETKVNRMSLDNLFSKIEEGKLKELELIIKADVQGSVEALKQSLEKLSGDEVVVKIIHSGVGAITESDVSLAMASNAIIIGFDVRPDNIAKSMAEREGVEIKLYNVIYQAIDDVEAAMKGMLAPVYEEKITGHAEVRQIFKASSVGNIAGSYVLDGTIQKGCKVRIRRGEEQIFEGNLGSLKRFKDDVKEVREGYECGLVFDGFDSMNVGDVVEAYTMIEIPREKASK
ncbi:MAG: translation initiation factor IF-2 [Lachnospiraceae bacterium]|nr:translation initiation factor IF-2 [Lachnospiraceae bacterium]